MNTTKAKLIEQLQLEPHIEGGYFRRHFASDQHTQTTAGERALMSSIFYLLTDDQPIGHWHRNRSSILHFWQAGQTIDYWLISPAGELQHHRLGPNIDQGDVLQLTVPGDYWKASELTAGEYGLISEAVCPGFDYADMTLANKAQMAADFPQLWPQISRFCKTSNP